MQTWQIDLSGIVQGVGFRPFVHTMAQKSNIRGRVFNDSNGVKIIFNADSSTAQKFYSSLITSPPAQALVTDHQISPVNTQSFSDFTITDSESTKGNNFRITPDLATCKNCTREILDPKNRRYQYAFTTCTDCGPRFSILKGLPFDRERTAMHSFNMCPACLMEYQTAGNTRHHSQTNSCKECGVTMQLYDFRSQVYSLHDLQTDLIRELAEDILTGAIVAIKGIGGFLLICDATKEHTVAELRKRKNRPRKPFALMYPNFSAVCSDFEVNQQESALLRSSAAPIVLLAPKETTRYPLQFSQINPGLNRSGIMLPYAPLWELLMNHLEQPVVATSGNVSSAPIIYQDDRALQDLKSIADEVLLHNREIIFPQDDSVKLISHTGQDIFLRRARGYAPNYINPDLKLTASNPSLAMGADLKNTFCLEYSGNVFISPYLGDMSHFNTQENAQRNIARMLKILEDPPEVVLVDKHPHYESRRLGKDLSTHFQVPVIEVQHHVAHFCALLGEHSLLASSQPILGVIWDGMGYGDDEQVWGSEFFVYKQREFSRVAHLQPFPNIAGDKMAKEPRLSALAISHADRRIRDKFDSQEWNVYRKQGANKSAVRSSSMGRLFDAVASLLDLADFNTYEAETAMYLESLASNYYYQLKRPYDSCYEDLIKEDKLNGKKLLGAILIDLSQGAHPAEVALKFYLTLVFWIKSVAIGLKIKRVGFSGGVFQSGLISDILVEQMGKDFDLIFHKQLSPNDENISFGQLIYQQIMLENVQGATVN
jgi:hydrogenase maturation protein HypF